MKPNRNVFPNKTHQIVIFFFLLSSATAFLAPVPASSRVHVQLSESSDAAAEDPFLDDSVRQTFSFWSKLMVIGDASPNICRYPSQTSILQRHDDTGGWQNLSTTRTVQPPVVELLDAPS